MNQMNFKNESHRIEELYHKRERAVLFKKTSWNENNVNISSISLFLEYDIKLHTMVRHHFWSTGEDGELLHYHYSVIVAIDGTITDMFEN